MHRTMLVSFAAAIGLAAAAHGADPATYAGNYRLSPGHTLAVAEWEIDPGAPHALFFTDLATGRAGLLTPDGDDELVLPATLMGSEEAARLRMTRARGVVTGLLWIEKGRPPRPASRIPDRREEVTFVAEGVQVRGTLWLPSGRGPFPAVVLVPAGRLGRTGVASFTNLFLAEGLAVLAYDGRAEKAPFPAYAADALAAVEQLRRRPEIDAARVGLWGHSQGGWLALMAAARSPHVAFVIDHSGMLVPAWQQELYRLQAEATADGIELEQVQKAVAFETALMRVARSGQGWDEVAATLVATPVEPWRELVYRPSSLDELQSVWRDDFSFDPRPHVAGVGQPVLALFGGLDRSTPIESAANLVHAVGERGAVTVAFFPTADHAFLDAKTGGKAELPSLTRFAPGMIDAISSWLRAHGIAGARQAR